MADARKSMRARAAWVALRSGKTDGEDRNPLNLVWQWTHVVDACDGKQLADPLKANLRIASRHDGADPLADNPLGLRSQLLRDSESCKELGGKVLPLASPNMQ